MVKQFTRISINRDLMCKTMINGSQVSAHARELSMSGHIIHVTYGIKNGLNVISNGWVK